MQWGPAQCHIRAPRVRTCRMSNALLINAFLIGSSVTGKRGDAGHLTEAELDQVLQGMKKEWNKLVNTGSIKVHYGKDAEMLRRTTGTDSGIQVCAYSAGVPREAG